MVFSGKRIRVMMYADMPIDSYVGGVETLVRQYISNKENFKTEGVELDRCLWKDIANAKIKNTKVRFLFHWLAMRRTLLKECRSNFPDILHIHTSREFIFLRDVITGAEIAKRTNVKCTLTVHVGDIKTVFNRIPDRIAKWLISLLNERFSKVFFLSNSIMEEFIKNGLDYKKCQVLYNFHEMPLIEHKENDRLKILFVGSIQKEKGIVELLEAIKLLNQNGANVQLDICGMFTISSEEDYIRSKLSDVEEITILHGYITGKEKIDVFNRADVFVLPSYHEGLPLAILEALGSGCAIVATKVGAIPEILGDDNAIWVSPKDSKSVYDALMLLNDNPNKIKAMKEKNIELSKKFEFKNHLIELCNGYKSVL